MRSSKQRPAARRPALQEGSATIPGGVFVVFSRGREEGTFQRGDSGVREKNTHPGNVVKCSKIVKFWIFRNFQTFEIFEALKNTCFLNQFWDTFDLKCRLLAKKRRRMQCSGPEKTPWRQISRVSVFSRTPVSVLTCCRVWRCFLYVLAFFRRCAFSPKQKYR